jgi:RNA polymerase sigma-70 factor (ECF subfamily)
MVSSLMTRGSLLARLHDTPGDDDAWAEFVRIYGEHVIGWCLSYGLQRADAADVAQEVLVRFWKQAAKFSYDPTRRFRGYLRRIVVSALSDRSARIHDEKPVPGSGAFHELFSSLPAREDLVARIEAAYDMELFDLACREVESRVQPRTWEAFRLLALENRSGKDVAEAIGISVGLAYMSRCNVQKMIQETVKRLEGGSTGEAS